MSFKFIDLFAGIGWFRIAMNNLWWECVFTSEIDKHCQATYRANFWEFPYGDIHQVDEKIIPKHDVLCWWFPCQPFSISGLKKWFSDETKGNLFFEIIRIVNYHKPKVLFLENVKWIKNHDWWNTMKTIEKLLDEEWYNLYCKVLNAVNWWVPQARQRLYMVCIRKDIDKWFTFPKWTNQFTKIKDIIVSDTLTKHLVITKDNMKYDENKEIKNYWKPLKLWTIWKDWQWNRIYSENTVWITLTASSWWVASKTWGYLINGKVRKLHPTECKRMQGFPEDFKIVVSETQAQKQFWNAVAVPVVEAIWSNFLGYINNNQWVFSQENLVQKLLKVDLETKTK